MIIFYLTLQPIGTNPATKRRMVEQQDNEAGPSGPQITKRGKSSNVKNVSYALLFSTWKKLIQCVVH